MSCRTAFAPGTVLLVNHGRPMPTYSSLGLAHPWHLTPDVPFKNLGPEEGEGGASFGGLPHEYHDGEGFTLVWEILGSNLYMASLLPWIEPLKGRWHDCSPCFEIEYHECSCHPCSAPASLDIVAQLRDQPRPIVPPCCVQGPQPILYFCKYGGEVLRACPAGDALIRNRDKVWTRVGCSAVALAFLLGSRRSN